MSRAINRIVLTIFLLVYLSGCNLPREQTKTPATATQPPPVETNSSALEVQVTPTEKAADFDPLELECLVGTWEVDSASLLYAGNMLVNTTALRLVNVSPHLFFRFTWDEPLLGSTHMMEVFYIDVLLSGLLTAGDGEHLLDMVFLGSTTAYFSASPIAGEFEYQNDPEKTDIGITSLKMDGLEVGGGVISLNDLVQSIPTSTMFYTCPTMDTITFAIKMLWSPFSFIG